MFRAVQQQIEVLTHGQKRRLLAWLERSVARECVSNEAAADLSPETFHRGGGDDPAAEPAAASPFAV